MPMTLIEETKQLLDSVSVVSFDIFDTLLLRPYRKPSDLFKHIGIQVKDPNYAIERVRCEAECRKLNSRHEDVTLGEIYKLMDPTYCRMQEIEIQWETQLLQANPEVYRLFEYACEQRKTILITSDMYLPKDTLEHILSCKGIKTGYKLFVSCEYRLTKSSGNLFSKILEEEGIDPRDMLHIGDNEVADFIRPGEKGIRGVLYVKPFDRMIEKNRWMRKALERNGDSLSMSIVSGLSSIYFAESDKSIVSDEDNRNRYWRDIGYYLAAVACYGYTNWLRGKLAETSIRDLLFVARDGYCLRRMFSDIFNREKQYNLHYVYASRLLRELYELNGFAADRYASSMQTLPLEADEVAIIDTITLNFSAQQLLGSVLKDKKTLGFYWFADKSNECHDRDLRFETWYDGDVFASWEFMEFLMSAPTPPVVMLVDSKPIYQCTLDKAEILRISTYSLVAEGIDAFSEHFVRIFGDIEFNMGRECVAEWINSFVNNLDDADRIHFKRIKHSAGSHHSEYHELFPVVKRERKWLLFGFIPLVTIKHERNKIKIFLFSIIPFLKINDIQSKARYYLFFIFPLLKVK